jgi:hypothetical protein
VRDICWCNTHPQAIVAALKQKRCFLGTGPDGRIVNIGMYDHIEIIDNNSAAANRPANELRMCGETAG